MMTPTMLWTDKRMIADGHCSVIARPPYLITLYYIHYVIPHPWYPMVCWVSRLNRKQEVKS